MRHMDFIDFGNAEKLLLDFMQSEAFGPTVRIQVTGIGCMGPSFALIDGVATERDLALPFHEYTLIADKADTERFGGYIFKATRVGIRIMCKNKIEGDCSTCMNEGRCH